MQKIYLLIYPLVNLYPKSSCVTLSFLQVDELASLQVYELLVILYANLRSFTWLFGKQLVHLSSCSLVHLLFFKYMFSCLLCLFRVSWQVNKSTSIRVACYSIRKSSFFYSGFLTSNLLTCQLVDLFTRYLLPIINKKTLARSQGFSGAYETRTRDLLRDRQAF